MIRLNEKEFTEIVAYMREFYGINLNKKKTLIECRLTKELQRRGLSSFGEYLELLKGDRTGKTAEGIVNQLTTNYTYFMREPVHFTILKEKIFPELFREIQHGICNIWCAGCSTGEECYTLAMLLQDYKEEAGQIPSVRMQATDISREVLEKAQKGVYPLRELERLPAVWQKKYCRVADKKVFQVNESLKYNIMFRYQNLMQTFPASEKYHVILCRNVMIYFDKDARKALIEKLENSLHPGGYLLIGHAELLSRDETRLEQTAPAVYRKQRRGNGEKKY